MKKTSNVFFDPPEGARYGFPKRIPQEILDLEYLEDEKVGDVAFREWLIKEGYPKDKIDLAEKYGRCIYDL